MHHWHPEGMTCSDVALRWIQAVDELSPVLLLAGEFEEWIRGRLLADYGVDAEFTSERDLFFDLEGVPEPRARLYVAEVDGEPVGMGGLRPLSAHEAEIKRMYVRPSARGQGVGRAILQRLIKDARELGYSKVNLDSARFMHEAHALYRSFGFLPSAAPHSWEFESKPELLETAVFMTLDLGADSV
jgi:GNAT superfamily N-acetyltransferase